VEVKTQGKRIQGLLTPGPEQFSLFKALGMPAFQHKELGAQPV